MAGICVAGCSSDLFLGCLARELPHLAIHAGLDLGLDPGHQPLSHTAQVAADLVQAAQQTLAALGCALAQATQDILVDAGQSLAKAQQCVGEHVAHQVADRGLVDDAEDELQAIIDEYTDAYSEFMTAYRSASTDEERQKIVGEKMPPIDPYAARVLAFVKANPDSEAAWTGIQWIMGRGSRSSSAAEATRLDHLVR